MSYGLMPYAVDWKRITTIHGCRDETLLGIQPEIDDIVLGNPLDPASSAAYYYALERICGVLGNSLSNERLDRVNLDALSDIDAGMAHVGAVGFSFVTDAAPEHRLLPLDPPADFPVVYAFSPDVCARAKDALAGGMDELEDGARWSIEEIVDWLDERQGDEGIVVFSY